MDSFFVTHTYVRIDFKVKELLNVLFMLHIQDGMEMWSKVTKLHN